MAYHRRAQARGNRTSLLRGDALGEDIRMRNVSVPYARIAFGSCHLEVKSVDKRLWADAVSGPIPSIVSRSWPGASVRWIARMRPSSSATLLPSSRKCSTSIWINARNGSQYSLSRLERASMARCPSSRIPCGSAIPNSPRSSRIWLASAVRDLTSPARARCSDSIVCCACVLTGTKRMFGRCTASQIASASAASVLLLFT